MPRSVTTIVYDPGEVIVIGGTPFRVVKFTPLTSDQIEPCHPPGSYPVRFGGLVEIEPLDT
jgi:hypothetical protein